MLYKILTVALVCLCFSISRGQKPPEDSSMIKSTVTKSRLYDKPHFPSAEEIEQIKNRTSKISFPRATFTVGLSLRSLQHSTLDDTYLAIESYYGVSHKSFRNLPMSFSAGFRLHLSKRFAFWWEYVYGGDPGESEQQYNGNIYTLSYISLSALYSLLKNSDKVSLSLGIGIASQRLRAIHSYYEQLYNSSGTLETIKFDTGKKFGVPFTLLLELPAVQSSRYTFYSLLRYIASSDVDKDLSNIYSAPDEFHLKSTMSNWQLNCGITAGF